MNNANDIIDFYNNKKIPLIIDSKLELSKNKFIVPRDMTISQFHYILSKKIKKNEKDSLILFVNNILPQQIDTLGSLYNLYKNDEDNYLHITVRKESTFG